MDDAVKTRFLSAVPALADHWEGIAPFMRVKRIADKTTLLSEGDVSKHLYFIVDGSLRLFYIKRDGTERTSQFFFEGQFVASLESFFTQSPSRQYLESLESSRVCVLSASSIKAVLGLHPALHDWYFGYLKDRLIHYTQLHSSYILDSPEERYLKLIKSNPMILKRVPQYHIASYLGITPVSLSRIRSRIKKRLVEEAPDL